jgi:hypothetical protein
MKSRFAGGLILGLFFSASSWAGQSSEETSEHEELLITIGVYDYAGMGTASLAAAKRATSRILRNAGVSIAWMTCPDPDTAPWDAGCANLVGPLKIALHILPESKGARLLPRREVFGLAAEGTDGQFGCDLWVFYERITDPTLQVAISLSLPQIVGAVIAHELGHLLLGSHSHSSTGIMRAHWSRGDLAAANLGGLGYSSSECARIRNAVAARQQASLAATGSSNRLLSGALLVPRAVSLIYVNVPDLQILPLTLRASSLRMRFG